MLFVAPAQVSRKEVDKQTQKIRSAAAPEERAAIEQADMEQLSRQLQQLDHAPIGRAARAAWLQEQQQKRQLQQQAQQGDQAQNAAGNRSSSGSPASDRTKFRGGDDGNPFAIPQEVRANWDADLENEPRAAAPRRQISRAVAPSSGSRSSSRSGSRSGDRSSPGAGSDNPFAIPQEARKQWQAEDHMFSEPGKPILGGVLGGLVKLTSGKAQPTTAQLHQERRRQAMKAEEIEAAAILRLQQQEGQQQQARTSRAPVGAQGSGRTGLPPRAQQQPAAATMPEAAPQAPAAAPAAAAAAPSGFEGLEEGSPEWAEKMRQEMLKNGAARRARMQQMRAQGGPALQQGRQVQQAAAASSSGTLSAAVSAADAQGVTAAIPAPQQPIPAGPAMAADDAAAASSDRQKADQSNPSAV